jgi:hypothetical protein
MADFQPPPTYSIPILVDKFTNPQGKEEVRVQFDPNWLRWFLDLIEFLNAAGGISGLEHNLLVGLQGGTTDEYYHLTAAQHSDVTSGASFKTIQVSGQDDVVAVGYSDTLILEGGSDITITTDAGTKTVTISFSGSALPPDDDYGDIVVSGSGTVWTIKASAVADKGYWSPVTNGDAVNPELIFDSLGNVVVAFTATP